MKKLQPATAYYLRNVFDAFNSGLIFTAIYVYYARTLGLTPLQLSLTGTVLMATGFVLELPTGLLADVKSRKWSVILGGALIGLCFILVGSIPAYAAVLAAAVIEAVGGAFVSGALDAWLTDEVGADKMGAIILRGEQIGAPAHWAGVAASVALATLFNHQVPIVAGGALWLVASVVLAVFMPETGMVRDAAVPQVISSPRTWLRAASATLASGLKLVRVRRTLLMLFSAQLLIGAFYEGFFRLYRLHLFTGFALPVVRLPWIGALDESVWIALMDGATTLLYFVGLAVLRRRVDVNDARRAPGVLLVLFALVGVGAVTFALTPSFGVAVAAFCVLATLHNMTGPLLRTWLNQHITRDVRATVLSMNSQVNQLGQLGGGLGIGALGNAAGLRIALAASAAILVPLLTLLWSMGDDEKSVEQ